MLFGGGWTPQASSDNMAGFLGLEGVSAEIARYLMPEKLRDRPFWDCTSFPLLGFATMSAI